MCSTATSTTSSRRHSSVSVPPQQRLRTATTAETLTCEGKTAPECEPVPATIREHTASQPCTVRVLHTAAMAAISPPPSSLAGEGGAAPSAAAVIAPAQPREEGGRSSKP